jgi:hypothetical protein
VQDGVGQAREAFQAAPVVEVALDRNRASRPQHGPGLRRTGKRKHAKPARQPGKCAQRDVAAAYDQDPFHIFIISRTMTHRISLRPGDHHFEAAEDQTLQVSLGTNDGV